MKNTISIIIPFYNCKNDLSTMLDSILAGSMLPYEILLVDDGSNDTSPAIASDYASKYNFIKVLTKEHSGVSAARNLGIQNASGYWISFLDADDYIEPDMYEKMLKAISQTAQDTSGTDSQIDGCLCGYYTHKDNIVTPYAYSTNGTLTSKDLLMLMFTDDSVRGFLFTRLFRAELLKEISFDTNIRVCEDLLFQTKLFTKKDVKFACLSEPKYHYIQRAGSATVTRSFFDHDIFIYKPAYELISECLKDDFVLDSYNSIMEYTMYTLLNRYSAGRDSKTLAQIRLLQKEMKITKTPSSRKSRRRIAFEIAPVLWAIFKPKVPSFYTKDSVGAGTSISS